MNLVNQKSYSIAYAKTVAIFSLIIGLTIFTIYYFYPNAPLIAGFGLLFLFLATIINLAIVLRLFFYWKKQFNKRTEILKIILLVSINIPLAIMLTYFAFKIFVNNMD